MLCPKLRAKLCFHRCGTSTGRLFRLYPRWRVLEVLLGALSTLEIGDTAGYVITGGTGRFMSAKGTGNAVTAYTSLTSGTTFLHIEGNIQLH